MASLRWWGSEVPFYRVEAVDPQKWRSDPVVLVVEADDAAGARNIAASKGLVSGSVERIEHPTDEDRASALRKQPQARPTVVHVGPSILEIAVGVFVGLLMFALLSFFVSCSIGNPGFL